MTTIPGSVYDAPMALDLDLSHTDGLDPNMAGARIRAHFLDTQKCFAGPMPIDLFLETVLGVPAITSGSPLSAKNAFKSVPPTANTPAEIYKPLLEALNKRTKHKSRSPGFVFEDTAQRSLHPKRLGYAKPHLCFFAEHHVENVRRASLDSRVELGYAELFIQVTPDATRDFFTDPPPGSDEERRASHDFLTRLVDQTAQVQIEEALGLHVAFVTEVFARQHRMGVYTISMAGSRARILYWDRAGCIVSEAFDIRARPEYLCTFLWYFSQAKDHVRGHDSTVGPASLEEELQFRDAVKQHVRDQLSVDGEELDTALKQHYQRGRVAVIKLYPHQEVPTDENCRRFIISRPVISPLSHVGRGTRGYWAVESATSRVVFLKDTWRPCPPDSTEGHLLEHLNALGVRNIPSFIMHGDVPQLHSCEGPGAILVQGTSTDVVASDWWVCPVAGSAVTVIGMQHYRLVMGTVGYGLKSLRGTEELLHATYDVFTAMRDAFAKDARIHRDISLGNIILVKEPGQEIRRGYLIDWESSDQVDDTGQSVHAGRTGTWPFMAWRMLSRRQVNGRHNIRDDMDSLVHVVMYCALHYLPHEISDVDDLAAVIGHYFHSKSTIHAGLGKLANTRNRVYVRQAAFRSQALVEWLNTVLDLQCPISRDADDYNEKFTPQRLDENWAEFLRTHTLECNDRVVHEVINRDYLDPRLPTTMPTPARSKRSGAEEKPMEAGHSRKRLRSTLPPVAANSNSEGLRRSQRIRNMQDCASNTTSAAPTVARKASAGRRAQQSRRG